MSSVGSFFSYVNDARSHEPEEGMCVWTGGILHCKGSYLTEPVFYTDILSLEKNCALLGYWAASSGNF